MIKIYSYCILLVIAAFVSTTESIHRHHHSAFNMSGDPTKRKVSKVTDLKKADQICFDRRNYEHHAIVVDIYPDLGSCGQVELVHFTGEFKDKQNAKVVHEMIHWQDVLNQGHPVYVLDYGGSSLSPDEVVRRAKQMAHGSNPSYGSRLYDLVHNNCEHFATWCKTGVKKSSQVIKGVTTMGLGILGTSMLGAGSSGSKMAGSGLGSF